MISWDGAHSAVSPGPAALRFARSGIGREDLVELAQPIMRRLPSSSATLRSSTSPPETVTDRARLEREREAIRDQGYGTIVDELEPLGDRLGARRTREEEVAS